MRERRVECVQLFNHLSSWLHCPHDTGLTLLWHYYDIISRQDHDSVTAWCRLVRTCRAASSCRHLESGSRSPGTSFRRLVRGSAWKSSIRRFVITEKHNGLFPRIFNATLRDRCASRLKSPQNNNFSQIVMNENFNSILFDFHTYCKTNFCKLNVWKFERLSSCVPISPVAVKSTLHYIG